MVSLLLLLLLLLLCGDDVDAEYCLPPLSASADEEARLGRDN